MRVYKCDRCGKFVTLDHMYKVASPRLMVCRFGRKKHLCKDCAKSFREWFNAPKSSETAAKLLRNEVRNDTEA